MIKSVLKKILPKIHDLSGSDEQSAKEYFKKNIKNFHMEISSYCNRQCPYCPVAYVAKESDRHISSALVDKILNELQAIDYSKTFLFHFYNEPLYDCAHFKDICVKVREKLPRARLKLYSNGDYLTREILEDLKSTGLNSMNFTMHYTENWDVKKAEATVLKFYERIQISPQKLTVANDLIESKFSWGTGEVNVCAVNFSKTGQDRGNLIDGHVYKAPRTKPCTLPSLQFNVDYTGNVIPCCNLFPRHEYIKEYVMGNLMESSMFEIFSSKKFSDFRKQLLITPVVTANLPPACQQCTDER